MTSLALLVSVSAARPIAFAQVVSEDAEYRELVRKALAEFDAKSWQQARAAFSHAHALQPSARTLRGLGMVAFEMQEYVEAYQILRAALDDPRRPLEGTLRADTEALLQRTRSVIARVVVDISPAEAQLRLDGADVERDSNHALWMRAGAHVLRVSALGYESKRFDVKVRGGDDLRIRLDLGQVSLAKAPLPEPAPEPQASALDASLAPKPSTDARDPQAEAITDKWWFWAGAGVLAVGLGATVIALASGGESREPLTRGTGGVVITTLSLP